MSQKNEISPVVESDNILDWGAFAKCKGQPAEWWYVESYQSREGRILTRQAKVVCDSCDVKKQCLEYAIENEEEHGLWGGLTPKERGVGRLARIARHKNKIRYVG